MEYEYEDEDEEAMHVDITISIDCPLGYDVDRVTKIIGRKPTKIWRPRKPLPKSMHSVGWNYCWRLENCACLDDALIDGIDFLWGSHVDLIQLLNADGLNLGFDIHPFGWQLGSSGMYIASPRTFARLSILRAKVYFRVECLR